MSDVAPQNRCLEESNTPSIIGKTNETAGSAGCYEGDSSQHGRIGRNVIGVAMLSVFLAPWHMLPVFSDIKIAKDPLLPGLTNQTLPITATAIFGGWLLGSVCLNSAMATFSSEQLIVGGNCGLLVVTILTLSLTYLTRGNVILFCAVRFLYGILMNAKPVQLMYVQDRMTGKRFNQALVTQYVTYGVIAVALTASCGWLTSSMHWTLEFALWCGLSRLLGMWLAFPNAFEVLDSIPKTMKASWMGDTRGVRSATEIDGCKGASSLIPGARRNAGLLIVCFIACGCGFYGLTFSAGQLSPNIYLSSMALGSIDIVGYLAVTTVDCIERRSVQLCSFLIAALCLLICSTGEPGSNFVLVFAVIGRLGIDVCFATCYLVLADIFSESERLVVLPLCETAARLGSLFAPFAGTLPSNISCPLFAMICFSAACATLNLPRGKILT